MKLFQIIPFVLILPVLACVPKTPQATLSESAPTEEDHKDVKITIKGDDAAKFFDRLTVPPKDGVKKAATLDKALEITCQSGEKPTCKIVVHMEDIVRTSVTRAQYIAKTKELAVSSGGEPFLKNFADDLTQNINSQVTYGKFKLHVFWNQRASMVALILDVSHLPAEFFAKK